MAMDRSLGNVAVNASSPIIGSSSPSSWQQWAGMGALGGGMAGLLGNLFGGGFQNPADSAMPYLDKIPSTLQPYFQPYIQHGEQAYGQMQDINKLLQSQYGSMMGDPNKFLANISSGYKQSPGYQFALNQALQGAKNAAASGGSLGTPANQQQMAGISEQMANRDFQQYLQNALGILGTGQQGMGGLSHQYQDIYGIGANMSGQYGTDLAQALMSQAQMAEAGSEAENKYNQSQMGGWGNLAGIGLDLLGL